MTANKFVNYILQRLCLVAIASVVAIAATPTVTTVAGGYLGDGKPATSGSFVLPVAVARDAKGNIYVSDGYNCRIRRISSAGVISTYAGTGICGYSGDGGPAISAMLSYSYGAAFDRHGNLLVADTGNNRVRKITPLGTITTIAGNGTYGYSGDGGDPLQASLAGPSAVCGDLTGNIYIADSGNYVIRMVDTSGIIHTVAGNHTYGFSGDGGPATSAQMTFAESVVADSSGNFYIADTGNKRVRKVDSTGEITTYAGNGSFGNTGGGGPATSASMGQPAGLVLTGSKLHISTGSNIWDVKLSTQIITIVAGYSNGTVGFNGDGYPAVSTGLSGPWGMTSDSAGNLIVADSGNDRVRKISGSNQVVTTIGGGYVGDGGRAIAASLNDSLSDDSHIAFDPAGNLYIADIDNHRVRKVTLSGTISTFAGTGIAGYSGDGGPATAATLSFPGAVAADGSGNIFVADSGNGVIRKVDSSGTITTFSNVIVFYGAALAVDTGGNLYAADGFWTVWKIAPDGSSSIVAGVEFQFGYNGDGIPATQAWLSEPNGLALDAAGNLYISDMFNYRIRKVDTSGIISTIAGNGTAGFGGDGGSATSAMIYGTEDVAVDARGNLYIADSFNSRVRIVNRSGVIQTFAGSGNFGYNGDGLGATQTNLFPTGLAVRNSAVYLSDTASYRVRKIR
jgi:sugar lactone lactonase YvrE